MTPEPHLGAVFARCYHNAIESTEKQAHETWRIQAEVAIRAGRPPQPRIYEPLADILALAARIGAVKAAEAVIEHRKQAP